MWIWVPSAEAPPTASRTLPDCGFRIVPFACGCHTCEPVPLQVHSCTLVPLAVPALSTSRHLPSAWKVLPTRLQRCAALPLQVHNWIFVPSAVPALSTSRHLPAMPVIGPDT